MVFGVFVFWFRRFERFGLRAHREAVASMSFCTNFHTGATSVLYSSLAVLELWGSSILEIVVPMVFFLVFALWRFAIMRALASFSSFWA